jgi:deoxyribose-phosphate aldolase
MTKAEQLTADAIAQMIDHTLLKPEATTAQIDQLCIEAREYHFAAVCVNPTHVARCARNLEGTSSKVCTVIGFPLGANLTEVKVYEAKQAIENGATEIDMVINIGGLKSGQPEMVKGEIAQICHTCHNGGAVCKVIIEAALLSDEEKVLACQLAVEAGADYVKTSTGFGPGGASAADVALMRQTVGPNPGVKAAGGIRSFDDARRMIDAGATRIGASAGIKIVDEARKLGK